jgi:glycosyltransferase involved in cell wall biosynthesis
MRIGIFVLAAGRTAGGPETYEVQLIRALAGIDSVNSYFIYCTSRDAAEAIGPLPDNFTYRVLRPAARSVSVALTLPRWMARDGVDFFHATYAPPPLPNKPFLFTLHCASNLARPDFYPTLIRWRLNALQRIGLRRAAAILCVSDFVSEHVRQHHGVAHERLSTVYNGVAPEFAPQPSNEARARILERFGIDAPYVLYVGKLQARKNVIGLIRAFARYRTLTGSAVKLVLVGKRVETSEGISEARDELGLAREVIELGYVSPPSADPLSPLPHLYAAARMTVFPSFYEGFGIPVVEAMACACPVVASNVTSIPEIAGDAAMLVDPNSVEEIAAAMARIDGDPELRRELIARGFRRAGMFTWDNCARQTLAAYQRLRVG